MTVTHLACGASFSSMVLAKTVGVMWLAGASMRKRAKFWPSAYRTPLSQAAASSLRTQTDMQYMMTVSMMMHACVWNTSLMVSSCGSTFHVAVRSLLSSSWIWVDHNETNPKLHLLPLTEHRHMRPPLRVLLPGPEVGERRLNTHRF